MLDTYRCRYKYRIFIEELSRLTGEIPLHLKNRKRSSILMGYAFRTSSRSKVRNGVEPPRQLRGR